MKGKELFRKIHLWLGLTTGLVVITVCITGAILVFKYEIEDIIYADLYYVTSGVEYHSIDGLVADFEANHKTEGSLRSIFLRQGNDNSLQLGYGDYTHYINPYTGAYLGNKYKDGGFFDYVLALHRRLLLDKVGRWIVDISVIVFILQLLIGLYLWWPKKNMLKKRFTLKWNTKWKIFRYESHNVLGFYALIFLLLIAAIGLDIRFKFISDFIKQFDHPNQPHSVLPKVTSSSFDGIHIYDRVVAETNTIFNVPGNIWINVPKDKDTIITLSKKNEELVMEAISASTLSFNKYSGELIDIKWRDKMTTSATVKRALVPAHEGTLFGMPSKIINFLITLVGAWLAFSGFAMWWGKRTALKNQ